LPSILLESYGFSHKLPAHSRWDNSRADSRKIPNRALELIHWKGIALRASMKDNHRRHSYSVAASMADLTRKLPKAVCLPVRRRRDPPPQSWPKRLNRAWPGPAKYGDSGFPAAKALVGALRALIPI